MFQQESLIGEMGKLRKFALKLAKNTANAEDLLQSTMLRALEKQDRFENGTNLFGWTSKIMFNLFISGYRSRKKFESQYDPAHYIDQIAVGPTQEAHADLVTVTESMKLLSQEHREILQLVCVQEMRYDEAAEMLRVPVGTVRSRLSRARNQLQDLMTPIPRLHAAILPLLSMQGRVPA